MTERLTNLMIDAFNDIVDDHCELYGVEWTIEWLLDRDFTKEDLLKMRFDEKDIDAVIEGYTGEGEEGYR